MFMVSYYFTADFPVGFGAYSSKSYKEGWGYITTDTGTAASLNDHKAFITDIVRKKWKDTIVPSTIQVILIAVSKLED